MTACIFCQRPLALGDRICCTHHRAVLASVIDPEQAQWTRDHPESGWRANKDEREDTR